MDEIESRLRAPTLLWRDSLMIVLLVGFVILPSIALLAGYESDLGREELRHAAPFPQWPDSTESVRGYPEAMESYINDSFGLRSLLVSANSWLRLQIGASGSSLVLAGRDGWLFLNNKKALRDLRGLVENDAKMVDRWFCLMEERRAWLEARGIGFWVVFAPNKHTIYREYLPAYLTVVKDNTMHDLMVEECSRRGSQLQMIDLRPVLLAAKREHRVYHRTDSHWNHMGAFLAYREVMGRLQVGFPELEPLQLDDFQQVHGRWAGLGNARMLGISKLVSEEILYLRRDFARRISDRRLLDAHQPVSTSIAETNLTQAPVVFIVGDSFIEAPLPYFEESFSRTITTDRRGRGFDRDFILEQAPDLVIFEIVERCIFQELVSNR